MASYCQLNVPHNFQCAHAQRKPNEKQVITIGKRRALWKKWLISSIELLVLHCCVNTSPIFGLLKRMVKCVYIPLPGSFTKAYRTVRKYNCRISGDFEIWTIISSKKNPLIWIVQLLPIIIGFLSQLHRSLSYKKKKHRTTLWATDGHFSFT